MSLSTRLDILRNVPKETLKMVALGCLLDFRLLFGSVISSESVLGKPKLTHITVYCLGIDFIIIRLY